MSKARFHFEQFWPKFDDYDETIAQAWQRPPGIFDPLLRLDQMLRNLIRELQRWSSTRIGDVKAQLLLARELVLRLDVALERRQLSEDEANLLGLSSMERTMARQRSRVRQLREGDANTAYFHMIARGRKRRKYISALAVDGHTVTMHADMERAISNHFTSVFGAAAAGGNGLSFPNLGLVPIDLAEQEEGIGADEVWAAIKSMPSDRVPGPDGFNEIFYKTAWPIIKPEIMEAIQVFYAGNNRNFHKLNTALVVLLPKKIGASCPADFRPITMIHSFAKLISKVLALRLASRMNDLVDHNQNAFVRSRSIHDNYKYVQRAAVLIRSKKRPMLLLKLDISKAFDTLS